MKRRAREGCGLWLTHRDAKLRDVAASLKASPEEVPARVAALVETAKRLERELAQARQVIAMGGISEAKGTAAGTSSAAGVGQALVGGHSFHGEVFEGLDPKSLRGLIDQHKKQLGSGVVALVTVNDGRASVAVGVTDDLVASVSAVDLVKAAVVALGGQGGGGRPDMAQGGGPDGDKASEALSAVRETLEKVAA